jgi:peroxiredoxin
MGVLEAADAPLTVGDPAPDLALADDERRQVRLSELWRNGPLVLFFVRHLG